MLIDRGFINDLTWAELMEILTRTDALINTALKKPRQMDVNDDIVMHLNRLLSAVMDEMQARRGGDANE